MKHITVLQAEAVDALDLSPGSIVVDATFGGGGHAREILSRLDATGTYIGIDADDTAFSESIREEFSAYPASTHLVTDNFRNVSDILMRLDIPQVDAILADFGWRSEQFQDNQKGFSFNDSSMPLMTYGDPEQYLFTAYDIVNDWEEENIADVIYGYGEERGSRRIAKAIVEAREIEPISSSTHLAEIVKEALPSFLAKKRVHPATKTFQALRIAVNDELGAIESLILNGFAHLKPDGTMAVITFHSIEDRLVKNLFKAFTRDQQAELYSKKPLVPSDEEQKTNPRSRSAKLRALKKV